MARGIGWYSDESQLLLFILRHAERGDAVGLAQVVFQIAIRKAQLSIVLDPLQFCEVTNAGTGPRS